MHSYSADLKYNNQIITYSFLVQLAAIPLQSDQEV